MLGSVERVILAESLSIQLPAFGGDVRTLDRWHLARPVERPILVVRVKELTARRPGRADPKLELAGASLESGEDLIWHGLCLVNDDQERCVWFTVPALSFASIVGAEAESESSFWRAQLLCHKVPCRELVPVLADGWPELVG